MAAADSPEATPAATDPPAEDAPAPSTDEAAKPKLSVTQTGNLATASGTGFEPGARYDVAFVAPSGNVAGTAAFADADGSLTSYGRILEQGKYKVEVRDQAGTKQASAQHVATPGPS